MKVNIIPEKCIACGLCHIHAPELFDYYDNGIVKFYDTQETELDVPESEGTIKAVKNCPTGALIIKKTE